MLETSLNISSILHHAMNTSIPVTYWLTLLPVVLILIRQFHSPKTQPPRGCRRLGLRADQSNIRDEFDPKYSNGVAETHIDEKGRPSWRIKALFTFPIKSCAGVELDAADVVPTGLAHDRQFCFAEYITPKPGSDVKPHWTARTLRDHEFSAMTLIRPEIWIPDPSAPDYAPHLDEVKSNGVLVISYPRPTTTTLSTLAKNLGLISKSLSFRVPLTPPPNNPYPSPPVKIWKDSPYAHDYAQHIPSSLRTFLCASNRSRGPITLFRVDPAHHRQIFRCAPPKESLGFQTVTGFADAYPLHILSLASVQDVASRCATALPRLSVRRFRANVIIQGPAAFTEDHWKRIRIRPVDGLDANEHTNSGPEPETRTRGVEIHTVCRTMRCRLPNVDPDTGIRHPSEPDRSLKAYRRIDPGDLTNAALGMQAVPAVEEFELRVGDGIEVVDVGEHFYIKMLAPGEKVEGV